MSAPVHTQADEPVVEQVEPATLHAVPTDDTTDDTATDTVTESGNVATDQATGGAADVVSTESYGPPREPSGSSGLSAKSVAALARAAWKESAAAGSPLTGRELGEQFDRSERWGRDRIAEARRDTRMSGTAGDGSGGTAAARTTPHRAVRRGTGTRTAGAGTGPESTRQETPKSDAAAADAPQRQDVPVPASTAVLPAGARLVAWLGFAFGTVISVAANVMYVWLPTLAGTTAAPGLAPQVGAAVWPIALVISVEVLSRVPWRPGRMWQLARYGGAGVVAVGAAVISYGHLSGVLTAWGYGPTGAAVGPLVVDGLMTISGFALLAMSDHGNNGGGKAAD